MEARRQAPGVGRAANSKDAAPRLRGFRDLEVYKLAYQLAMQVFEVSKGFPSEERYSLTGQVRRASRSVASNIAEGYRKRQYPRMFVSKMADADGEGSETQVWLDFARDCGYLAAATRDELCAGYERVGEMLGRMIQHPERFLP